MPRAEQVGSRHAEQSERSRLILAWADRLLGGWGRPARWDFGSSAWCTRQRAREGSLFPIGKALLGRGNSDPEELLRRAHYATEEVTARWG